MRQRNQTLAEVIVIVLVARDLQDRRNFVEAPALYRRPGHGEGARVLDRDRYLDRAAVGRELPALDRVDLRGVRRAIGIDEGFVVLADGIDDKRIAFIVPHGLAIPGRFDVS